MKETMMLRKLAKRIKELRKSQRMSQERLAEKADLSPTYIGNVERAEQNPTLTSLEKIAGAFNVSVAELLTFPDDRKIIGAKTQDLNQLIVFLNDALELAKRYKTGK